MKVRDVMQTHVTVVRDDESLALAQQLMFLAEIRHLPVLDSQTRRVVGMLSERDLLRAASLPGDRTTQRVREFMVSPAEHIHPHAELADAAADMTTKRLGCLPVIDAGELVGLITRADVLSVLAQYPTDYRSPPRSLRPPPTAAIMHPEPLAVRPESPLLPLAASMASRGLRHACVVDDEGRVVGIVSDRDIRRVLGDPLRALEGERMPEALRELTVAPVMTRNPRTIDQDEPFTNALPVLVMQRVGALPVVDGRGRLRGILSYLDVLKALAMYVPTDSTQPPV